ncbi:MAG: ArsI/CadI family heavy metal resistance metalloenzyme [Pseudomonadota bacterium]
MKRMHLHVSVDDMTKSIEFYNSLLGVAPTVVKLDYAKWMLDDPLVNFAISNRGAAPGLDHIGIQVEDDMELLEIKQRLDKAELNMLTEQGTTCCYAKSDKHWVQDPSGIAWEAYRTLESAPTFSAQITAQTSVACCVRATQKIQFSARK